MEVNNRTFLSFQIGEDTFAVDALFVDHILEVPSRITKVPNTPDYMKGVINLHGNIVPVADMRIVMDCDDVTRNNDNSIIVINPLGDLESRLGILVDMVKEVIETNDSALKETVMEGKKGIVESFEGTLVQDAEFIHIIDIKNLTEIIEK
jgi:purine-binding chemotaxis protein CheW